MSPLTLDVTSDDGTGISVLDEGQGHTILIVHPGGGTSSSWTRVAGRLSQRYRVLRFDRRPYRDDPEVQASESMDHEVADVAAIAYAIAQPLLLVGHSSGAVVALESALASPSQFAGMVLYEPPVAVGGPLGGDALVRAQQALDSGDLGLAMKIHLREIVEVPGYQVALLSRCTPLWRQMIRFAPGQISDDAALESLGVGLDRYAELSVLTLLVGGARSPKHLRRRLDALAHVLPQLDSEVILRGQGHLANARAPGRLVDLIDAFAESLLW